MLRIKFFVVCIIALIFSGCSGIPAKPAYEVTGGNSDSRIFLACNLWFTESKLIPVENYPKGGLLNVGTEVKIISYNKEQIHFSTVTGLLFTILYNEQRTMMPVEEYMRLIFSLNDPLAELDRKYLEAILNGNLQRGMDKKEVFASVGPPIMTRTPNWLENNTWTYWAGIDKYRKVVFKENKLLEIIE